MKTVLTKKYSKEKMWVCKAYRAAMCRGVSKESDGTCSAALFLLMKRMMCCAKSCKRLLLTLIFNKQIYKFSYMLARYR